MTSSENGDDTRAGPPDAVLGGSDALLFDSSLDGMLVVDCSTGLIARANEAVERLLAYPTGTLTGKPYTVLFPGDGDDRGDAASDEILAHDMVFRQDFRRADGSVIRLDLTAVMVSPGGRDCILVTLRDTREREAHERRVALAARTDALTGLYSRAELMRRLELEHQRALRYHLPYCVCFCDIDHYKQVNDEFGHIVGDSVLKAFARSISVELRANDFAGRYGGDEIVIVLPHAEASTAFSVVERIRKRIASRPLRAGSSIVKVTGSFGIAEARASESEPDQVLQHADQALYEAKSAGRNRTMIFSDRGDCVGAWKGP